MTPESPKPASAPSKPPNMESMIRSVLADMDTSTTPASRPVFTGSLLSVLVLGLLYFGQSQLNRLDTLQDEVTAMRLSLAGMKSEITANGTMRADLASLREQLTQHSERAGHPVTEAKFLVIEQRLATLERRIETITKTP